MIAEVWCSNRVKVVFGWNEGECYVTLLCFRRSDRRSSRMSVQTAHREL